MFIIESKSVTEEVRVRPDNTGGDQWSRVYQGRESGMPSPIQKARRQAGFLRTFLERHREQLLGKPSVGMRTLARFVTGKDHGGFLDAPIQLLIAISDKGRIKLLDGWTEPQEPFRDFVTKADLVPDKIAEELERYRKGATSLGKSQGEYGLWDIEDSAAKAVAEFLAEHHAEPSGATAPRTQTKRAVPIQSRQPLRKRPTPDASTGRVEDWRASFRVRWPFRRFRSGPQSGSHGHVSSPRSPNPACPFRAPGSPVGSCGSHTGNTRDGRRSRWSGTPTRASPEGHIPLTLRADRRRVDRQAC